MWDKKNKEVRDDWIQRWESRTRQWGKREVVKGEWKSVCRGNYIKPSIFQSEHSNIYLFTSLISLRLSISPPSIYHFIIPLSFPPSSNPSPLSFCLCCLSTVCKSSNQAWCRAHHDRGQRSSTDKLGGGVSHWKDGWREGNGWIKGGVQRWDRALQLQDEIHEKLLFSLLISLLIFFLITWIIKMSENSQKQTSAVPRSRGDQLSNQTSHNLSPVLADLPIYKTFAFSTVYEPEIMCYLIVFHNHLTNVLMNTNLNRFK